MSRLVLSGNDLRPISPQPCCTFWYPDLRVSGQNHLLLNLEGEALPKNDPQKELRNKQPDVNDGAVDLSSLEQAIIDRAVRKFEKDPKILVVDDDPDICEELAVILTDNDLPALFVNTVAEAREMFYQIPFEVIVLDLNLPDGSGFDLIEHIYATAAGTRVIGITGDEDSVPLIESARVGFYDYMFKPFDVKILIKRIKQALVDRDNND